MTTPLHFTLIVVRYSKAAARMCVGALLFILLAAGCRSVPEAAKTRAGPHFEVVCHFECGTMAAQALSAAERAWRYSALLYGEPAAPPEAPLTIHLYRSSEDVDAVRKRMQFDAGGSFADPGTRTAHVNASTSYLSKASLLYTGTPAPLLRLVAHEAAHLASYQMAGLGHSLPSWITEGSAVWIAHQVTANMGLAAPNEEDDSRTSSRIRRVQRLLEDDTLPDAASIFRDEWGDLSRSNQYAVRWLFFTMLYASEEYRPTLKAIIALESAARRAGEDAATRQVKRQRLAALAGRLRLNLAAMDRDFRAFVGALEPQWNGWRSSLETGGAAWSQFTSAPKGASWNLRPVPHRAYALSGALEIVPGTGGQMNVLLGSLGGAEADTAAWGGVKIAFVAGQGVEVMRHAGGAGDSTRWTRIDGAAMKALRAGTRIPFRIERGAGRLRVSAGGAALTDTPLGPSPGDEHWGLGGEHGTAGLWHDLRVEPLTAEDVGNRRDGETRRR